MVKCLIFLVIITIFAVVIFLGFYLNSRQNKVFKEQVFYYVCAAKQKGVKKLEEVQDEVKEVGGAGIIYKKDKFNYLILNVYLDEESAANVVQKNKEMYPDCVVFELKTKKLSNSKKRQLKSVEDVFKFFKLFNLYIESVHGLSMKYFSGEISDNSLCGEIMSMKFNLEDLFDQIDSGGENEIQIMIKKYLNLKIMYFESFLKNFLDASKKKSILCEFMTNLTILKVEMFNNL